MSQTVRKQEKPTHYSYLKSFRVDQCKDFLNHQCTHHRPYTCFHWHFPNQRRRRCNLKDGTFNYHSNDYCTKYSESNGVCPDGENCPFLHKNIGDTERRFHLKNYKTELCLGEVDLQGVCSRNGYHCSSAHGQDDLRNPILDNSDSSGKTTPDHAAEIRQSMASVDLSWADVSYMMENYKVEKCDNLNQKHQQLLCPYYHSIKEKRRNIKIFKYRAVACPMVKQKEEWGEASLCEERDKCPYSHTRTELQYHPDVFRTVPCQNELKNGYCSKGIFCAFAHNNNNLYIPVANNQNHKDDESKIVWQDNKQSQQSQETNKTSQSSTNNKKNNKIVTNQDHKDDEVKNVWQDNKHSPQSQDNKKTSQSSTNHRKNNQTQKPADNFSLFSSLFSSPSNSNSLNNSTNNSKQEEKFTTNGTENHEIKEIESNDHILDQLDNIDTNDSDHKAKINGNNQLLYEDKLKAVTYQLAQSESECSQLKSLSEELFQLYNKLKEDKYKLEMQLEYSHSCNTASFVDDGQVLHTLHPSFNLDNSNLTILLRVQSQLQKDLTKVYNVLTRITGEKCLLCRKEDACMVLTCQHKTLCHVCYSYATACPLCFAPFSSMQSSIPYHLHL